MQHYYVRVVLPSEKFLRHPSSFNFKFPYFVLVSLCVVKQLIFVVHTGPTWRGGAMK